MSLACRQTVYRNISLSEVKILRQAQNDTKKELFGHPHINILTNCSFIERIIRMKKLITKWILSKTVSFFLLIIAIFLMLPATGQNVSPSQGGHYAPSIINVRDMAKASPGFFIIDYNIWLSSTNYIDRNGDELKSINISQLDPGLPDIDVDFDISSYINAPALFWASKKTLLGGARYLAGISPCWLTASGTVGMEAAGSMIDTSVSSFQEGSGSGWSDLFISPLGLSWGFNSYDLAFSYGFYAPTGKYETEGSDNIGSGFWTHQFQGYGYYYPVADQSTAIMLGLTYELNGEIKDAAVKPGNRFTLEWGISQYLSERLELSVQGGHNWQISDDKGDDVYWDATYHDGKNNLGFSVGYWPWKEKLYIAGKYAFDYGGSEYFKSNYWMANLIFIL